MNSPVRKSRSIMNSFATSKSKRQHGRGNVTDKVGVSQFISASTGFDFIKYRGDLTKTMQMQIVRALHLGERSRASSLLLDLGHNNHALRTDDFVDILRYCARSPDPLFVMETWQIMEEKDITLSSLCYMLMMQALCKGGYLDEAFNLINILGESHRICGILPIYNGFLEACVKKQSIIHANQCLDVMERRMVGKNEHTYQVLLKIAVWQKDLSSVHEIWKDYIRRYSPGILLLQNFIWSFTRLRDLKSAYETLQHMVVLAIRENLFVERTVQSGSLYVSRLDVPIPSARELSSEKLNLDTKLEGYASETKHWSSLNEKSAVETVGMGVLSNHINEPTTKLLLWSFNDVIHACAQTKNCALAEQLMLQMQSLGVRPSSRTYDGFVKTVVHEKGSGEGLRLLKLMQQGKLKPYDSTLAMLAIGFSRDLAVDLAEALLDQIPKYPHPFPYNAFFAACDMTDQPERAVRLLAKMKRLQVQPNIRTYELLFSLFGNVNAPYEEGNILSQVDSSKRINAIEMDMARNGIQHSHLSMKNLLKALGAEGMIREQIRYLNVAENLFFHNDTFATHIYSTVLHSLVKAEESHKAIEIFKNMRLCGLQPDGAIYNIMIDCCSVIRCFKSACALVSLLVRNGCYLDTFTYTSLIKVLLKDENFDEALNLLDQAILEGIAVDRLLYNTILRGAREKCRIDVMEFIVEQMRREKIQPDPSTCYYVFSAYVNAGYHSTAVEALQVLSMRMVSEDDASLQDKMADLEDKFILNEDMDAELKIIQLFKDSDEYIAIALLYLRWCATLGFPINWSPSQSSWARRLATIHDARNNNSKK